MNFHLFTLISFPQRVLTNSHNDQFQVGLIAQLVERWVRIPFKPEFFGGLSFRNYFSCVCTCDDHSLIGRSYTRGRINYCLDELGQTFVVRRIVRLDELHVSFVVRLSRRTTEDSSSSSHWPYLY